MSRIGKKPIPIPPGVQVDIGPTVVAVQGPKGALQTPLLAGVEVSQEEGHIWVRRLSDAKPHRAVHGLMRSLIANMVTGVTEGYRKDLQIVGVGYRADLDGKDLVLHVGYSHPIRIAPPEGIAFAVSGRNDIVSVSGIDKVLVGQIAANVRGVRKPEPYKGKGIRYMGEQVRRKAGKTGKV